ncbi:MAG: sugar transporter permease [Paenibacillaceae bacterium]|nr:sugar transporter permease [Paenibacillaceae bacterium]
MIKETYQDRIFNIVNIALLSLMLAVVLYPMIYVVSASISDPNLVNSGKMWLLPKGITFEGYRRVLQHGELWVGYRNTIFYTLAGTLINLAVTLPCAYALSRRDMLGRNVLTALFAFTMFFSGGLIPTYLVVKNLHLVDTIWVMLLPGATSMWNIVLSRTFFQSNIPHELQEAAVMDGCSNWRLFFAIVLPLSAPIIAVMALFFGVAHWNSFFSALIYLSDRGKYPLQLILREILVQQQVASDMMSNGSDMESMAAQARIAEVVKYAVIIVSTLPIIAVYPFLQRYFVQGIMVGAIKG